MECCRLKCLTTSGSKILLLSLLPLLLFIQGCHKPTGKLNLSFVFSVDDNPLIFDSCIYVNYAGNHYEITDVQYFISEIELVDENGANVPLTNNMGIHYVDARIPSTLSWTAHNDLTCGKYKELRFVFGLRNANNITGLFPNPPENNMSWPQTLGGGYHYMKINGRWLNSQNAKQPFNLHLGKVSCNNCPSGSTDNVFSISTPIEGFVVTEKKTNTIKIKMDINKWFFGPNIFDFNIFGGAIMQDNYAQKILIENGNDVFSVSAEL